MCVIVAKNFPGVGWVAVKNRDRNYVPKISFQEVRRDGTDILYFWDDVTRYSEGLNSSGVCVLSASLMVADDEKEVDKTSSGPSKDGKRIRGALRYRDPRSAAKYLIGKELTGNTVIFNTNTMILLEGANDPDGEYRHRVRIIPKSETLARANHGIWLPWAGYQRDPRDPAETMSRISSESREIIAKYVVANAKDPKDLIDDLSRDYVDHPQLNVLRKTQDQKLMRTTAQIMLVPREKTMYVRPVQSNMTFDFWKLNDPDQKIWVELLSNRIMHQRPSSLRQPKLIHQVKQS